jgi:hypothetical protein
MSDKTIRRRKYNQGCDEDIVTLDIFSNFFLNEGPQVASSQPVAYNPKNKKSMNYQAKKSLTLDPLQQGSEPIDQADKVKEFGQQMQTR